MWVEGGDDHRPKEKSCIEGQKGSVMIHLLFNVNKALGTSL